MIVYFKQITKVRLYLALLPNGQQFYTMQCIRYLRNKVFNFLCEKT